MDSRSVDSTLLDAAATVEALLRRLKVALHNNNVAAARYITLEIVRKGADIHQRLHGRR